MDNLVFVSSKKAKNKDVALCNQVAAARHYLCARKIQIIWHTNIITRKKKATAA